ncbi:MAG: acetate kinase [Oscillospiraceae bacterium]|nr:acetate kinase [Oscillospiraceae bacterium]
MIFTLNFGSSSFKYKIFDGTSAVLEGSCEKIGNSSGRAIFRSSKKIVEREIAFKTHEDAFFNVKKFIFEESTYHNLNLKENIKAIGHRVVHGGNFFRAPTLIDSKVIEKIQKLVPLAPIHNEANLNGIRDCFETFGESLPQVAVFDTSFFVDLPLRACTYAIPEQLSKKYGIRKYGFHGISHEFANERYCEIKGRNDLNIITCHLGSGSSIAAISRGKPIDTSMGFTPLGGLVMGTRSGSLDPSVVTFIIENENLNANQINEILNKKSGILGISGVSSDIRNILEKSKNNQNCRLAIDLFCYSITKYIGSYIAALGRCDALIFTAGIGENHPEIRQKICNNLKSFGIVLNKKLNLSTKGGKEGFISEPGFGSDIFVVRADEELSIAMKTEKLLASTK